MSSRCGLSCLSGPAGWRLCGPKSQESHGAYKKQPWWESSFQPRPLLSGWKGAVKIRRGLAAGGLGKSSTTPASIQPLSQSEGLGSAQSRPPGASSELPEASRVSLGLPRPPSSPHSPSVQLNSTLRSVWTSWLRLEVRWRCGLSVSSHRTEFITGRHSRESSTPSISPKTWGNKDFRGSPGVKNLTCNAGDTGLIPGLGRFHMQGATEPACHHQREVQVPQCRAHVP